MRSRHRPWLGGWLRPFIRVGFDNDFLSGIELDRPGPVAALEEVLKRDQRRAAPPATRRIATVESLVHATLVRRWVMEDLPARHRVVPVPLPDVAAVRVDRERSRIEGGFCRKGPIAALVETAVACRFHGRADAGQGCQHGQEGKRSCSLRSHDRTASVRSIRAARRELAPSPGMARILHAPV